ncbi:MAG: hypothetical protein JOY51_07075 [Nevskia sp.]|nr:hypothetical protein [Nevskia sp.]
MAMTLAEAQALVDRWIRAHGGYWDEFVTLARLTEELGEVAAALQRLRGYRPVRRDTDLALEVGDLLFILLSFANTQGLDAAACLEQVLEKYDQRDG